MHFRSLTLSFVYLRYGYFKAVPFFQYPVHVVRSDNRTKVQVICILLPIVKFHVCTVSLKQKKGVHNAKTNPYYTE